MCVICRNTLRCDKTTPVLFFVARKKELLFGRDGKRKEGLIRKREFGFAKKTSKVGITDANKKASTCCVIFFCFHLAKIFVLAMKSYNYPDINPDIRKFLWDMEEARKGREEARKEKIRIFRKELPFAGGEYPWLTDAKKARKARKAQKKTTALFKKMLFF